VQLSHGNSTRTLAYHWQLRHIPDVPCTGHVARAGDVSEAYETVRLSTLLTIPNYGDRFP
jgi:hypothetical protein